MPGLPRGWWAEMDPDDKGVLCQDCDRWTFGPWRWNNNRRARVRKLCADCFEARKNHQDEHRYGLVNPVERGV